jgi:uncharacterized protein YndB with AHSA1/START domain
MTLQMKYSAEINRPVETTFAIATDIRRLPEWANVKEVRRVSSQPIETGATFQLLTHLAGEDRLIDCHVTACERNRRFVYVSGGLAGTKIDMTFEPDAHRCKLRYVVTIKAGPFIEPLIKRDAERRAQADLARLVRLIESS